MRTQPERGPLGPGGMVRQSRLRTSRRRFPVAEATPKAGANGSVGRCMSGSDLSRSLTPEDPVLNLRVPGA
jgi:hypothetical protein